MKALLVVWPLDAHLRRTVLAKRVRSELNCRASRGPGRISKTPRFKHAVTTSGTGVDYGPPVAMSQIVKQKAVSAKADTRW